MDPIRGVGAALSHPNVETRQQPSTGASFGKAIGEILGDTNQLLNGAESAATDLARGKIDSVEALVTLTKADLALRHVAALRNRALEAYQEIMRLPL